MGLQIAIVGLPNVGKSSLFNALTKTQAAQAANYPFCTIDPNVGVVEVPDDRLKVLASMVDPERVVPAIVEFVDVAGLVKGAHQGEGLGNQFLSHIRSCQAIVQVVRFFSDPEVIHVHEGTDPRSDREVVEAELILADLQTLEKRMEKSERDARGNDKEKKHYHELLMKVKAELEAGHLAIHIDLSPEDRLLLTDLHLLTAKPIMWIANVDEKFVAQVDVKKLKEELGIPQSGNVVPISAKVESELAVLDEADAALFLEDLGLKETGLKRLIREAYELLGLQTYFTVGKKEVRAWTIPKGASAPQAAGVIHTDFEKGFIRAEVIACADFVSCGGELKAKEKGLMRLEGKEYLVHDGDIMHFRFSD